MGKGDIKTKRGKISNRSYGVRRKAKSSKKKYIPTIKKEKIKVEKEVEEISAIVEKVTEKKPKEKTAKKPAAKKAPKKSKEEK